MKAYKVFDENLKCKGFQYEVGKTYELKENGELISPIICRRGFHACEKVSDCFNYYDFDPKNRVSEVELSGDIINDSDGKSCSNIITIVKELSWEEMLKIANTGRGNSGNSNSGNWNLGNRNSGNWNSGNRNSGDWNSGNWNSGNSNSGNWNSGNRNSGDWNSGDWNSGNYETGHFNSIQSEEIRVFNKPIKRLIWENCNKPNFIYNIILNEWVSFSGMTDEEKIKYPKTFVCDGYLKRYTYKEAWKNAYEKATKEEIVLLKALPNFDAKVFEEITGIKVE